MKKAIIILYSKANEGKTTTLKELFRLITNIELFTDFVQIIEFRKIEIGFVTSSDPYGDNLDVFEKEINNFIAQNCDIIICTARTSGRAKNFIENTNPVYNKIWLSTILSTSFDIDFFNNLQASHLLNIINQIINNNENL